MESGNMVFVAMFPLFLYLLFGGKSQWSYGQLMMLIMFAVVVWLGVKPEFFCGVEMIFLSVFAMKNLEIQKLALYLHSHLGDL